MSLHITLSYTSGADLQTFLVDQISHGAVLLPVDGDLSQVSQFEEVTLHIQAGDARGQLRAQVLQVMPGTGLALELADIADLDLLVASAGGPDPAGRPLRPPTVELAALSALRQLDSLGDGDAEDPPPPWEEEQETSGSDSAEPASDSARTDSGSARPASGEPGAPLGSSPVSWSLELLMSRWDSLTLAERVRVARYGNRPARGLVLRGQDRTLHVHLLHNPGLTAEEVAQMAGLATLDPATLKRIAQSIEWQKQTPVARALICNPKLPLPLVTPLLRNVPRDDLSRLARTGKVRGSVKEAIVKHLDRTR